MENVKNNSCKFCLLQLGEESNCPICGCATPERVKKEEDENAKFTDYSYNRYDRSLISRIYKNWLLFTGYLFYGHGPINRFLNVVFSPLLGGKPSIVFSENEKFIDVGCGRGFFLTCLLFGWEIDGCDIVEYPDRPKNVFVGNFERIDFEKKYSIVRSSHSLEHAMNPKRFLDRLIDITETGGTLVISSPNSLSWSYKIFKKHWLPFNVDSHFCILNIHAINDYLKGRGCKVIYKNTYTLFSSAGSLVEVLGIENYKTGFFVLFSILLLPFTIVEFVFNRSDSFIIYAKKV